MKYEIHRTGRKYMVTEGSSPVPPDPRYPSALPLINRYRVFGPANKAACRKFIHDREAIERNKPLRVVQGLLRELANTSTASAWAALDNQTCHAVENHAAASRGKIPPWSFHYRTETSLDIKDITSLEAAVRTIQLVYVRVREHLGPLLAPFQAWARYDCGHVPQGHSDWLDICLTDDGAICYSCADKGHVQSLDDGKPNGGYLSSATADVPIGAKPYRVTTWTGGHLMWVTKINRHKRRGFGGEYDYATFQAKDDKGRMWSGRGPGPGMYCNLRRIK